MRPDTRGKTEKYPQSTESLVRGCARERVEEEEKGDVNKETTQGFGENPDFRPPQTWTTYAECIYDTSSLTLCM
jgi:hypothetical protein